MIGFGRIGQLVANRAQAFAMEVVAYDKFVAAERFRELGRRARRQTSDDLYAKADIVTIHLPKTPDTINWIRCRGDREHEGRGATWSVERGQGSVP